MFCQKCGSEINGNKNFCSNCGAPLTQANTDEVRGNNNQIYTLTVNRANQWFAVNPAVKIVIDGTDEYRIENNSSIKIPITAGVHNIAFSCSIRNKIVNINVVSDCALNMKWNRITGSLVVE